MKRTWIIAGLVLTALAVSGCKKEAATETAAPAETATPTPAADPALAAAANPIDFDMRSFAGTFSGTLPCADCPGTDSKIELTGDGTYKLDESPQGKQDGNVKGDGNWTVEEGGARLRLDPNSKSDEDRLFAIAGKDELHLLDKDGKPVESAFTILKRAPAQ